ncbi:MAG TPA: substrate-binding domain-containing protein [Bacillales bacterium]|nr:substrate-binding domain-containing protein [Bacillales bacterium]
MKKVTMADVAKRANVSKSTVSQYLNKRYDYMGEKTKQRIEEAIHELGYQANFIARSLKQKRTSTIGVIVANILHTFSTQVIRSIEDLCNEQDMHVIVCNADDDPEKEKKYINMLRAKQVDGLIVFPTGGNMDLYESMIKEKFPLVFIDRLVEGLSVDTFLLDNEDAAKQAVDHLIEKGHRRIGIITTSLIRNITSRMERISGFKKALAAHGVEMENNYIKGLEVQEIQEGLSEMLGLQEAPTAIFAGNDLSLMEILHFMKERQIKIPDDLALINIDDVSFADIYSPPLTTISQPTFQIGKEAAALLLEKIKNPGLKRETEIHRFKGELVIRESC